MFYSILFPTRESYDLIKNTPEPECFHDLFLDQIMLPIIKAKPYLSLGDLFYRKPKTIEITVFRQKIAQELDSEPEMRSRFAEFSDSILDVAIKMEETQKLLTTEFKGNERWKSGYLTRGELMNSAEKYMLSIENLQNYMSSHEFISGGLIGFKDYLETFTSSRGFAEFSEKVKALRRELNEVKYNMKIGSTTIRVRKYDGEIDRGSEILELFKKFEQGGEREYQNTLSQGSVEPNIETQVLDMVARLYRDLFNELDNFCSEYLHFVDETLRRFAREIQFYLLWNDMLAPMRDFGLKFCYPTIVPNKGKLYIKDMFDIALGNRLRKDGIITNDWELDPPERIMVVTGPNQGGKTTFATAFGQANYIAALGLAIPGTEAELGDFDEIHTHFGKPEDVNMESGQLRDDIMRLHKIMTAATERSIIIVNEIYVSTTTADALPLAEKMMDALTKLGCAAVVVTYLDELAGHGPDTVSMVFTVDTDNPDHRTYKAVRGAPHGIAFAMQIAKKHNLTYEQLSDELKSKKAGAVK